MSLPIVGTGASAGAGPREPTFSLVLGASLTIAGYEAIHMIRKRPSGVECDVYCTASFSDCSRRRTELPIIYHPRRLSPRLQTCNFAFKTESFQIDLISTCTGLSENVDELEATVAVTPSGFQAAPTGINALPSGGQMPENHIFGG
jgi:hypothetical protein